MLEQVSGWLILPAALFFLWVVWPKSHGRSSPAEAMIDNMREAGRAGAAKLLETRLGEAEARRLFETLRGEEPTPTPTPTARPSSVPGPN